MAASRKPNIAWTALAKIDRHVEEHAASILKGKVAPENRLKRAVDIAQKFKMAPRSRLAWAVILGMAIERARTRTRGKPGRKPKPNGQDEELLHRVVDYLREGKARNLSQACLLAARDKAGAATLRRRITKNYSIAELKEHARSGFYPVFIVERKSER
jgi:hypothetical protein